MSRGERGRRTCWMVAPRKKKYILNGFHELGPQLARRALAEQRIDISSAVYTRDRLKWLWQIGQSELQFKATTLMSFKLGLNRPARRHGDGIINPFYVVNDNCSTTPLIIIILWLLHRQTLSSRWPHRTLCAFIKIRAVHLRYFLFFSIKKWFFCIFYQVNNLFLHQSYLKSLLTPSQITLIKNAKNHFLLLKKLKNTSSAQLWI